MWYIKVRGVAKANAVKYYMSQRVDQRQLGERIHLRCYLHWRTCSLEDAFAFAFFFAFKFTFTFLLLLLMFMASPQKVAIQFKSNQKEWNGQNPIHCPFRKKWKRSSRSQSSELLWLGACFIVVVVVAICIAQTGGPINKNKQKLE